MTYIAGSITGSFKIDLFVIWSEVVWERSKKTFLCQLKNMMLNSVSLHGVPGTQRVFLQLHDKVYVDNSGAIKSNKEWVLETDGINLKTVMCINSVDFTCTYSNSCIEVFNVLGIEAAHTAIMRVLCGVIKFDGSYVNYRHLTLLCDLMMHRGSLMESAAFSPNLDSDTSPWCWSTSLYATFPSYNHGRGPMLPTPTLNLTSPGYSPMHAAPAYSPAPLAYSPTSPQWSPSSLA
ncbi:hypothetical protein AZE42_11646 [Rhizopogon vesiculosus]|uniref:DNA-directed RNA polymerase n=1 Tax=Rhizopogon vesiculosus TaxID=180088 RepID=A0A1J8QF61_9AGAM|nr:hypothetical protein AZE42_11646 [Rhizopogon vesiculosus]